MLIAIITFAGLICFVIGICRRIQWRRTQAAYRQSPSVPGVISASSLRTSRRLDDDNEEYDVWLPVVAYRYTVGAKQYEGGNAHWFSRDFTDRDEAERWLASVPAGAVRDVFYDPNRPAKSALVLNEPVSAPGSAFIWLGVALFIGAFLGPAFHG